MCIRDRCSGLHTLWRVSGIVPVCVLLVNVHCAALCNFAGHITVGTDELMNLCWQWLAVKPIGIYVGSGYWLFGLWVYQNWLFLLGVPWGNCELHHIMVCQPTGSWVCAHCDWGNIRAQKKIKYMDQQYWFSHEWCTSEFACRSSDMCMPQLFDWGSV